ncbi:MAG: type II toxin-antitoxin system RelE/ParE family toxin [Candidatus Bipolaricaulota bacterium]
MRVRLTARAQKDLRPLPARHRLLILQASKQMEGSPLSKAAGLRRLEGVSGRHFYRLRVGSYRVLCTREEDVLTVLRAVSRQDLQEAIRRITGS